MRVRNVMTDVEELKIEYKSPEWYAIRKDHIGGSEAAAILGLSRWKSNVDLWKEKVGLTQPKNITNDRMEKGTKSEHHILMMFEIDHPEYEVIEYKDIVFRRGFKIASVDGGVVEKTTGRRGGIEIKRVEPENKQMWDEWDGGIPQYYYCQVLHYFSTLHWDFFILKVRFISKVPDETDPTGKRQKINVIEREYWFEREEESVSIKILDDEETKFMRYVKENKQPPRKLPLI